MSIEIFMKHFIYTFFFSIGFILVLIIISARQLIWDSFFTPSVVFVQSSVEKVIPFKKSGLEYVNTKHNYCFRYPEELELDDKIGDADIVNISGNGLLISVQAFENTTNTNILDFVEFINLSIIGELAEKDKGNSDRSKVIIHDYENPNSKAIFWEENGNQLLLTITGSAYDKFMEENDFIADLHLNLDNLKNCN